MCPDVIGSNQENDYRLDPTTHAAELKDKAPALAAILTSKSIAILAEEYKRKDTAAGAAQTEFQRTSTYANWAVFLAACFSACLLASSKIAELFFGAAKAGAAAPDKPFVILFSVAGIVSVALGTMWFSRAREGDLLEHWLSARAAAESIRRDYFQAVTSAPGTHPDLPCLQLEYFRRYQLDVQIAYYRRRGDQHAADAARFLRNSTLALAVAAIASGLASALLALNTTFSALAAVASGATAYASFASTRESIQQSRRSAGLYAKTYDVLRLLERRLDDVRTAVAAGQTAPLLEFVAAVHEPMAAEHRQWLDAARSIQPVLDKLEEALKKSSQAAAAKQGTPPAP